MDALPPLIQDRLEEVRELCGKYHVRKLTIFGSAVKGTFDPEKSDLDFIVEFFPLGDPILEGRAYLDLWRALRRLFGRKVDLIEVTTLDNPYFVASVDRAKLDLYDAA